MGSYSKLQDLGKRRPRTSGRSGITMARDKYGLPPQDRLGNPQDPTVSLGTLIERRGYYTRQWLASEAYESWQDFIDFTVLQSERLELGQALCVRPGSFSDLCMNSEVSTHHTSMMQLVAFESWINLLRNFDISFTISPELTLPRKDFHHQQDLF